MSNLVVYIKYKIWAIKQQLASESKAVEKLTSWKSIYSGLAVAFLIIAVAVKDLFWYYVGLIMFAAFAILVVMLDYRSGKHVHWMRETYKKKAKELTIGDDVNARE